MTRRTSRTADGGRTADRRGSEDGTDDARHAAAEEKAPEAFHGQWIGVPVEHDSSSADERARASRDQDQAARELVGQDRATLVHEVPRLEREIARLERELEAAQLDDLTHAYRRGIGERLLSLEMDRARRSAGRFVLAFVDVDGMKRINDREGHDAGDRVLKAVVAGMRARLRSYDPVVRYGGDEFLCGLGDADLADARRRFREIKRSLAQQSVGVSVGLAALSDGDTRQDLIERADAALRRAKSRRRTIAPADRTRNG